MKKQLLLFFWLSVPLAAFSQPALYLGSVNGWQGGTVALDVGLSGGNAPYAGFNATLQLPAGFQFLGVLNGPLLSGRGFIVAQQPSVVQGTNQLSILAYSGTNTFTGNGVLLSILLQISNTAPLGVQPVLFMQNNTNSSLNAHALSSQNGLHRYSCHGYCPTVVTDRVFRNDCRPCISTGLCWPDVWTNLPIQRVAVAKWLD